MAVAAAVFAQSAGDFEYIATNGAVTITGYTGTAKNIVIPEKINGLPVTAIGNRAFADKQLTGVTIPGSVTSIGEGAFYGNQLTGVTIGNGVIAIRAYAFANNRLTAVTVPNSVTTIGEGAFDEDVEIKRE
jgi:hypothetical protein